MDTLKVTLLQTGLFWESKEENCRYLQSLLAESEPSDVYVLPEMFSTGFSMNAALLAETDEGETVAWMRDQARRLNAAVTGSYIAKSGGQYFNRLVWMEPDGGFQVYDKRHLFGYAGESQTFTPGARRLVVNWRGWRICPMVCYDLRFPVWSRNDDREGGGYYDLGVYVANWPARRRYAWKSLLTARAIENQCYIVGVNRVGKDGNGIDHAGDSSVVDFAGKVLFQKYRSESIPTVALDGNTLHVFRKRFPFLGDQDKFDLVF